MKKYLILLALLFSSYSNAAFHYCSGKVLDIVTRASTEETQIIIENMVGWARINYGGPAFKEMHDRQFSMLLAAYMAGKRVSLEFASNDGVESCDDDHNGFPIRFVRLLAP